MEEKLTEKIVKYIEANEETRELILSSLGRPSLIRKK